MDDLAGLCGFILGAICTVVFAITVIEPGQKEQFRNDAVKHHAAEFYIDKDNQRVFRWLDEKPSPTEKEQTEDNTKGN